MITTLKKIPPSYYIICTFLLCLVYSFLSNDRLPFKYIDIFDERNYIEIIKNFSKNLSEQSFNPYYISRLFIPGIAHFIHQLFGIDYSLDNIQMVFTILNWLAIIIALYYYYKIVKTKNYSPAVSIIGFCFLFVNFFVLKFSNYYPILMDLFGFTSGMILYYYHIVKNRTIFFMVLLISMFIFPTTFLIAIAAVASNFIIFNKKGLNLEKYFNRYLYLIFSLCIVFELFYLYSHYKLFVSTAKKDYTVQSCLFLIPLTFILLNCFVFFTIKYMIRLFNNVALNIKGILSPLFIISTAIIILFVLISKFLSINFRDGAPLSSENFLFNLIFQAFSFPLKFLITHFIYYGLFVVFIVYFRNQLFSYAAEHSDPFLKIIIILFSAFFILGTETRQFLQFLPFIVFILLDAIKKIPFTIYQLTGIFTFQLLWSRFWYTINTPEGFLDKALIKKDFFEFPAQNYFQFQGPWLSTANSIIYGLIFILTFIIVVIFFKKNSNNKYNV